MRVAKTKEAKQCQRQTSRSKLIGEDGNAFFILGKVREALIKNGRKDLVEEFMKEAQSGNYDHLLATVMEYVEVE